MSQFFHGEWYPTKLWNEIVSSITLIYSSRQVSLKYPFMIQTPFSNLILYISIIQHAIRIETIAHFHECFEIKVT